MYTTTFTTVYISTLPGRGWFTITPGILGYDWGVYYISVTTIATKTVESPITTVLQTLIMESVTARDTTAFFIVLALVVGALILVMKARKKMSQQSMPTAPTTKNATSHKHQVADKSKFCRYCGAKIPHDSAFCDSCGKRL
jgi:ribosomal protein L40E